MSPNAVCEQTLCLLDSSILHASRLRLPNHPDPWAGFLQLMLNMYVLSGAQEGCWPLNIKDMCQLK